jgi:peptidoglycan/LPS O-acetylase OafA/YrhL
VSTPGWTARTDPRADAVGHLLFAYVVWGGLTYRRAVGFCALWTLASVVATGVRQPFLDLLVGPAYSAYFVAGVAMFLMYRFGANLLLWGIVGGSWVIAVHGLRADVDAVGAIGGHALGWPGAVVGLTAIFAVMLAVALGRLSRVRGAWLTTAGALTYPLYLVHQQIGRTVIAHLHDRVPRWPLVVGLTVVMLGAAWLVHLIVERPAAPRLRRALTRAVAQTCVDQHERPRG